MADGVLCWEKDSECFFDSDGEIDNCKNWLHDVSALRCLRVTKDFHCVSSKVRDQPYFDGYGNIKEFLRAFKAEVPREQRLWALKLFLRRTPVQWWGTHEEAF